jgi:hypothetical protein
MYRTVVQTKCNHGFWKSEFGNWDGIPSDPWWFIPEISDSDFLDQVRKTELILQEMGDFDNSPLKELDCVEGSFWFSMESQNLLSYNFTDPTGQLRRMAQALFEYMGHRQLCLKNVRVLMYMPPRHSA